MTLTPTQIEQAGRALFGEDWKPSFRDRFGLHERTLRRLLTGEQDAPDGLCDDIRQAVTASVREGEMFLGSQP